MRASGGDEWLVLLTSDHGGSGTTHGDLDNEDRRIPLLVGSNSPRVGIGRLDAPGAAGTRPADASDQGSHLDVLPTILYFLGGAEAVPPNVDGRPFGFRDVVRLPGGSHAGNCTSEPLRCACSSDGSDYRGTLATTETGKTCQRWDAQSPHSHSVTPEEYPDSGLGAHNYCRNPDGEPWAWCYTVDPGSRWELCSVERCDDGSGDTVPLPLWEEAARPPSAPPFVPPSMPPSMPPPSTPAVAPPSTPRAECPAMVDANACNVTSLRTSTSFPYHDSHCSCRYTWSEACPSPIRESDRDCVDVCVGGE